MSYSYSHRSDSRVPMFSDEGHIVFMDGTCGLCSRSARALARADTQGIFKIATVQSALGRAVLTHYGLDPDDPASWLYLQSGVPHKSSDAIIAAAARLSGYPGYLRYLKIIPKPIREIGYRIIARHRYRIMGRADLCAMPDPELQKRLL